MDPQSRRSPAGTPKRARKVQVRGSSLCPMPQNHDAHGESLTARARPYRWARCPDSQGAGIIVHYSGLWARLVGNRVVGTRGVIGPISVRYGLDVAIVGTDDLDFKPISGRYRHEITVSFPTTHLQPRMLLFGIASIAGGSRGFKASQISVSIECGFRLVDGFHPGLLT